MHAMKVSVYLFPLNSRENPRLLWLLTAASSSDVMGGVICIVVGGEGVVMHGRVVKPVYSCPPPPPLGHGKRWPATSTQVQTHARDFGAC